MSDSKARVVVESPYGGDTFDGHIAENVAYAMRCVLDALKRDEAPIASHLLFTQRGLLHDSDRSHRELGIAAGHAWIPVADRVVVYVDRGISSGMEAGIRMAVAAGVSVDFRTLEVAGLDEARVAELREKYLKA